jgi:hypothetical protein
MPLNRQGFPRSGASPDLAALAVAIRPTVGDPFYLSAQMSLGGAVTVFVEKPSVWTGPQTTAVQGAVNAALDASDQTDAQNAIDGMSIFQKAIVLVLIDELNIVRAALPSPLGARTPAQALTAIRAKAGTL